ncbi:Hsp33 family molecular chaperone HslO [Vibrio caribbeanicus]|uniref:33 kDa chaperonin n=1 Tax=Vibrio caribbeanicus ATCC BAA-2122 TaxID=796620 RepID=E3BIX2_9VIBR|nr:Hsp33 family molecular chaperone HslO [Vibrio caribbeanicus]EFP96898.1 Hsp33-like chaperonin [Vibrio caribbeanicus ATCC BAA-2122]
MASNVLNRYLFEDLSVRGELVQLDSAYQSIIANKNYPVPLQGLLGELLVATTLLTATLKFEGSITLQLQGDGPVSLAVINGDHEQKVRGVARFDGSIDGEASIHDMLGKGHLVITIDPKQGERYQGIVALDGNNLSEIIEGYFANSEQLRTRLWLRAGQDSSGDTKAAGMLLQILPDADDSEEHFDHLEKLTDTIKTDELFGLEVNELLYRLYNQEKVRIFDPQPVTFFCGCSRQRSAAAIRTIDRDEVNSIVAEEGSISLHCDYCGTNYTFDKNEVDALFDIPSNDNKTLH